jgi:hypothetical protein
MDNLKTLAILDTRTKTNDTKKSKKKNQTKNKIKIKTNTTLKRWLTRIQQKKYNVIKYKKEKPGAINDIYTSLT